MTAKECGEFITALRKEHELTQKQLAENLNVSDKAVSRWETGKGYPDVTSLVALSEYFGVSVNELLAGKRTDTEDITKIAEENIISVFTESEKSKKKQNVQIVLHTVVLLLLLLPALTVILKEMSVLIAMQVSAENIISCIVIAVVALWLLISGAVIRKGNVFLIHSYHYKNVTDFDGYSRGMGNTFMLMSIPLFISAVMNLFAHIKVVEILSGLFLFVGMIICIIRIFRIQIKFNGGLF